MYRKFLKSCIDIILSTLSFLILSPILLLIAVLIKLDSPGPVFFKQDRLGKNEKLFRIIKYRTMTHKDRKIHKQIFEGDSEVTTVGNFLRRYKLDELPQLLNVVNGEMAIVGPRPCLPSIKHKFGKYANERFQVKPGLSSLAAINGSIYLSWEEKGYWDAFYVQKLSFILDLKIIFRTIMVMFIGEKKMFSKINPDGNK